MTSYPFDSIHINQREVSIRDVASGSATAESEFEKEAFTFLFQWLNNTEDFPVQTSGSTGKPKTILLRRSQMEQQALSTLRALQLQQGGVAFVCLPVKYIAGKMMVVRAIINRMRLVMVEPSSNPLEKAGQSIKIDLAAFVPFQVQRMMDDGFAGQLNNIKSILIGGAAINPFLKKRIKETLTTPVYATYGMTETITHVALQQLNGDHSSEVFTTLPGIKIKSGDRGCLVITTDYLEKDVITNDLVEIISPNAFRWLGRLDNVINSGGVKVIPEQVEAIVHNIFTSLGIERRFFVAGRPDAGLGERVCLYIEGNNLSEESEKELLVRISRHFSRIEAPKEIIYIERFSETETGKVNINASVEKVTDRKK